MALREGLHGDGRHDVAVGDPPPDTTTRPRDGAHAAAPRRYGHGPRPRPERARVDSASSGRLSALRWTGLAGPRPAHIRLIDRRSPRCVLSTGWILHDGAVVRHRAPPPLDTVIPYQGQASDLNERARQTSPFGCSSSSSWSAGATVSASGRPARASTSSNVDGCDCVSVAESWFSRFFDGGGFDITVSLLQSSSWTGCAHRVPRPTPCLPAWSLDLPPFAHAGHLGSNIADLTSASGRGTVRERARSLWRGASH